ncbi:MAG: hypothetical protein ACFFG0_15430 [Candidatus Thorarchaeota archaeon]
MTQTPIKDKIQKILHPEKPTPVVLKPPKLDEKPVHEDEIDDQYFYDMAIASEFRRFVYWIRTGKTHRGSNLTLNKDLEVHRQKMEIVQQMPPELLLELKDRFQMENFGLTKLE